ncbi:MAG TPA: phage major capsid protein [Ruminococcaceae bacterium]|jgi:HK97 family phage major capsid protein|nr:phage major capsid protein [Oscillospiraceae bacterium]HCW80667.1 phage major capsid protein [Oscillospiraceae bacterium]
MYVSKEMRQLLSDKADAQADARKLLKNDNATAEQINAATERLKAANTAIEKQEKEEKEDFSKHHLRKLNGNSVANSGGDITNNVKSYTRKNANDFVKDHTSSDEDEQGLHIGAYLRGALTGNWEGAQKEKRQFQSLATAGGNILIPQQLSAQILAQVMNKSLLYGTVPVLPMESNNMTIAKVLSGPEIGFAGEGELAPGMSFNNEKGTYSTTDMAFTGVQLKSKTVRGVAKISNELLSSAKNLDQATIDAFSSGLADAIDKASIYGDGAGNTIKGIAGTEGVNLIQKGEDEAYIPYVKAVGAIRAANGEPSMWGLNASTDTALNILTDSDKNPLKVPEVLTGLARRISNNLRNNLAADGTTTGDEKTFSESLIFDPKAMVFGQQMSVQFNVTSVGMDALGTNSTYIAITSYIDFAVLQPTFISRICGI